MESDSPAKQDGRGPVWVGQNHNRWGGGWGMGWGAEGIYGSGLGAYDTGAPMDRYLDPED